MLEQSELIEGGTLATGYHRTRNIDTVRQVFEQGYNIGRGAMYGPGLYLCYDLSSQFTDYMNRYGDYLVKFAVNIDKFVNFDKLVTYDASTIKAILTKLYRHTKKLATARTLSKEDEKVINTAYELLIHPSTFTSEAARTFTREFMLDHKKPLLSGIDGLIFTGSKDGKVLVAYNPRTAIPIAYSYSPVSEGKQVKWEKFDNRSRITDKYKVQTNNNLIRTVDDIFTKESTPAILRQSYRDKALTLVAKARLRLLFQFDPNKIDYIESFMQQYSSIKVDSLFRSKSAPGRSLLAAYDLNGQQGLSGQFDLGYYFDPGTLDYIVIDLKETEFAPSATPLDLNMLKTVSSGIPSVALDYFFNEESYKNIASTINLIKYYEDTYNAALLRAFSYLKRNIIEVVRWVLTNRKNNILSRKRQTVSDPSASKKYSYTAVVDESKLPEEYYALINNFAAANSYEGSVLTEQTFHSKVVSLLSNKSYWCNKNGGNIPLMGNSIIATRDLKEVIPAYLPTFVATLKSELEKAVVRTSVKR